MTAESYNSATASPTDIAIIGMAGRFPGAGSVDEFWANLSRGIESVRELSEAELRAAGVGADEFTRPDYVRAGATLADLDMFDAAFFGINPKEAAIMDPQQRLFLECAWEALEHSGHAAGLPGELTGVFAGSGPNSYLFHNLLRDQALVDAEGIFVLRHMGNDKDVLATRVSYQLDLQGPSVNVQTACSTSLVAVHLACQSLLNLECDLALAGAVSVEIPHGGGYLYRQGEILSRDGHCRAFDARGTGTVFGSGAGIVVLRRMADAVAAGDTVHAVIKGSAINNDGGRKVGFLAPSVQGQIDVISQALSVAGVDADTIDYIEAHGTGTAIGDPIELTALGQVFGGRSRPLLIGSVKTNIGHLDTASGIAGLIKTTVALSRRQLPATLHFSTPNPQVDFNTASFQVVDRMMDWPGSNKAGRAGVTSLGIGGSNAHVVLEGPPEPVPSKAPRPIRILAFSAKSQEALEAATSNFIRHLERHPSLDLDAAAYTLQVGRRAFTYRRAVVCQEAGEALASLRALTSPRVATGVAAAGDQALAFVFAGDDAQRVDMGRALYDAEPVFRRWVDECAALAAPLLGSDFRGVLYPPPGRPKTSPEPLSQIWAAQISLFAVEYALAQLWMSWGVRPARMLGHGLGEYVAACLAEVLSLEETIAVVVARGRLAGELTDAAMLAVGQSETEIRPWLGHETSLAAVNGPSQCVLSGSIEAIIKLERRLRDEGIPARFLDGPHAFHSCLTDPIVDRFVEAMRQKRLGPPKIPLLSNVTGGWLTDAEATDCRYWGKHLRGAVRFQEGLGALLSDPSATLLEIGPGGTLTALAAKHPNRGARHTLSSSLSGSAANPGDIEAVLSALARLWTSGVAVDWQGFHASGKPARIPLPTYPFQRRRFWRRPAHEQAPVSGAAHAIDDWFYRSVWKRQAAIQSHVKPGPWLIFCDSGGAGQLLAEAVRARGEGVTTVSIGDCFRRLSGGSFSAAPASEADFSALVDAIPEQEWPRRIAYLWAAESSAAPGAKEDLPWFGLLSLFQRLTNRAGTRPIEINVFTRGAVSVRGEPVLNPGQATVAGLCRVAPREHANLECRWVDLDTDEPAALARAAILEMLSGARESTTAFRDNVRWVQNVEPVSVAPAGNRLRENGVYLITGGLGGLGLAAARWLGRACRARLVLTSRDAVARAARSQEEIQEIEREGGQVCVCQADVADIDAMRSALNEARRRFGGLHGVIHAAGVLDDGVLQLKTRNRARAVLSPKIDGTRVLYELLEGAALDFFALFSSISALNPPAGQVDYSAANAYLNAFAESCPPARNVVAIGWGAWGEAGMALEAEQPPTPFTPPHPLIDTSVNTGSQLVFRGTLNVARHWILSEHRLRGGGALFPGTGHLELAATAFWSKFGERPVVFRDITFLKPLLVSDSESFDFSLSMRQRGAAFHFTVAGKGGRYATGEVEAGPGRPENLDLAEIARRCPQEEHSPKNVRQDGHFDFGPRWHSIRRLLLGEGECLAELSLAPEFSREAGEYSLHPALLDMATGAGLFLIPGYDSPGDIGLPFSYRQLSAYRSLPSHVFSHVRIHGSLTSDVAGFDITIADEDGGVLIDIKDFAIKRIKDRDQTALEGSDRDSHEQPPTGKTNRARRMIGTREGIEALARILNTGARGVVFVSPEKLLPPAEPAERPHSAASALKGNVETTLQGMWQRFLGVDKVDLEADFFELGGHSLIAVRLFAEIREVFQADLGLATLFEARTIGALAARVRESRKKAEIGPSARPSCVVPIRKEGGRPPFFCIHGVGGNLLNYEALARHLSPDQPVYGLQSRGLNGSLPDTSIEEMAAAYLEELRQIQPEGPYLLGGHSFGGLVAYEMGCQLEANGARVGLIALIDTVQNNPPDGSFWTSFAAHTASLWGRAKGHGQRIVAGPNRIKYLKARAKTLKRKVRTTFYQITSKAAPSGGSDMPARLRDLAQTNWLAIRRYAPRPSPCSVTLFRCVTRSLGDPPDYLLGWQHLALGGVKVEESPGDHLSMMKEPHVEILARKLTDCLSMATSPANCDSALITPVK